MSLLPIVFVVINFYIKFPNIGYSCNGPATRLVEISPSGYNLNTKSWSYTGSAIEFYQMYDKTSEDSQFVYTKPSTDGTKNKYLIFFIIWYTDMLINIFWLNTRYSIWKIEII